MTVKYPIDPQKIGKHRTICEVLREIYRDGEARGDETLMARANEAHDYAKRMAYKLEEYAARYADAQPGLSKERE